MRISFIIPKAWADDEVDVLLADVSRHGAMVENHGRFPIEGDASIEELLITAQGVDDNTEMYLRLKYNVAGIWKNLNRRGEAEIEPLLEKIIARIPPPR